MRAKHKGKGNAFLPLLVAAALLCGCSKSVPRSRSNVGSDDGTPKATAYGVRVTASSQLMVASRTYIASALSELFGGATSADRQRIIDDLVTKRVDEFGGGPCDPYLFDRDGNAGDCTQSYGQVGAPSAGQALLPVIATFSAARAALVVRACESLLRDDQAVHYLALQAAASETVSLWAFRAPGDEQIAAAFELFYEGQSITPPVHQALTNVVEAAMSGSGATGIEGWRYLLLTLCQSPGWQIL